MNYQSRFDDFFKAQKFLPVCTSSSADQALLLAGRLVEKNILVMEIAYRNQKLYSEIDYCIAAVKKHFPQMKVGAATVINKKIAKRAIKSGADFLISPGFNPRTASYAKFKKIPFYPGVATPSEIERAKEMGFSLLKFFPAEAIGGVKMLKCLASPFPEVSFIVSGGINEENQESYQTLSNVSVISGSYLAK